MLDATRVLLAEGVTPTVEQAAARAAISRTTAYRYFPNQRALLIASYPELAAPSLLDSEASEDPAARLELVTESFGRQILEHEPELRAMLRLSLESPARGPEALPLRQGRAIGWILEALSPLGEHLTAAEQRQLAIRIRSLAGIESLVWLVDVAGLSRKRAFEVMRQNAHAVLASAIDGDG